MNKLYEVVARAYCLLGTLFFSMKSESFVDSLATSFGTSENKTNHVFG